MKTYKQRIIPQYITKQVDETICDCCGKKKEKSYWETGDDLYDEGTIQIVYQMNWTSYGDYGCLKYELDCCPDCFINKIVPLTGKKLEDFEEED